jgi:tetratricopeptide (TPR) repeat protein
MTRTRTLGVKRLLSAGRDTIGNTDAQMGLHAQAQQQLEQALSLSCRALGPDHHGRPGLDLEPYRQICRGGKAVFTDRRSGWQDAGKAESLTQAATGLAIVYSEEGKYAQSEALLRPALGLEERLLGPADRDTRLAMDELAWVYFRERKYGLTEALNHRLLAIDRCASGPQSAYVFIGYVQSG